MINWEKVRELLSKYFKYAKDNHKIRVIKKTDKILYEQDAENCWLFASMNNYILTFDKYIDKYIVKNYVKNTLWINENSWFPAITGLNTVCDITNEWIYTYSLHMINQAKLFAEMLKNWRSFVICIAINKETRADIIDNDIIDNPMTGQTNHLVNIQFNKETWRLKVLWNRGTNSMSDFEVTIPIFIKSIRKFWIEPNALFLDY